MKRDFLQLGTSSTAWKQEKWSDIEEITPTPTIFMVSDHNACREI
jgi:hypothetical protein